MTRMIAVLLVGVGCLAVFSQMDGSVENKSKGFTHCFLVTFRDEKGRAAYLPHPDHQAFVKLVVPIVDDVLVVDYWAKR